MAATNLNSVVSSIQGVSTIWIMEHSKLPTGELLEELPFPTIAGLASGAFDCIGKFGEGTFSQEGEDTSVESKKYTDGSVAFTTVKKGTYGLKGELHNVNRAICTNVLKLKAVAADAAPTTGAINENKTLVYDATSGWIDNAAVLIEFASSNAYKGMLIPNTSVASKMLIKGDSTDNMTIEMKMEFSDAPEQVVVASTAVDFTADYIGASFILIEK